MTRSGKIQKFKLRDGWSKGESSKVRCKLLIAPDERDPMCS